LGSTRYFHVALEHRRLEIGHTWYLPRLWGGRVNPACKLLLMTHAFEALAMNRVEFRTDGRNRRSQAALRRLGAIEEGVLRRHMIVQHGHVRDTVQFAVTDQDWPAVKNGLEARLGE
jgi:RimJ/RimL family protein N-acetyltransferase